MRFPKFKEKHDWSKFDAKKFEMITGINAGEEEPEERPITVADVIGIGAKK